MSNSRTDHVASAIVLSLTLLLTIGPQVSTPAGLLPVGIAVLALTALGWHRRARAAASLGLLIATCGILVVAGVGPQQVVFSAALAVYGFAIHRVRWLRGAAPWFQRGSLDRQVVWLGLGVVTVSAVALFCWHRIARPDLEDLVRTFVPHWSLWLLVPGAVLLAVINGATEEAVYRGVVLDALDSVGLPGPVAVVFQAVAFGALHFRAGFPRGAAGVGLACVFGLALGALRRQSGGLLAPWVVHVLTDLVIFSIVMTLARA